MGMNASFIGCQEHVGTRGGPFGGDAIRGKDIFAERCANYQSSATCHLDVTVGRGFLRQTIRHHVFLVVGQMCHGTSSSARKAPGNGGSRVGIINQAEEK